MGLRSLSISRSAAPVVKPTANASHLLAEFHPYAPHLSRFAMQDPGVLAHLRSKDSAIAALPGYETGTAILSAYQVQARHRPPALWRGIATVGLRIAGAIGVGFGESFGTVLIGATNAGSVPAVAVCMLLVKGG